MFTIENYNPFVFADVETMLRAKFANTAGMDNTVVVLGSSISKLTPEQFKQQHLGRQAGHAKGILVHPLEEHGRLSAEKTVILMLRGARQQFPRLLNLRRKVKP
jgi:hypothetical protein